MMSFPLLFLLLLPVALMQPPLVSGFQYGRCFQKLERHSIDNSQPLTEIFRSPALDCLEQCIAHTSNGEEQTEPGPLCRAVVYDHLQHSCRLFGHDGRKVPAVLHPANGFDLYRRTASSQECAGPVKRLLALQSKKNLLAAPSQQVNAEGGKGGGGPIPLEGGDSESPLNDHQLSSLLDQLGTKNGKGGGHHSAVLQSDPETADEETGKSASDCGAQVAGFFAFPGGQREEEGTEEFLGWSQRQCAEFCTENEGPDGETFDCVGFSHSPGGGKCRLHRRLAQGELSLQSIGGGLYAEKWCIPAHRFGLCRKSSQFKIHLQQRFHPQCVPIAVLENIPTLADCLRQCLDHLGCQSVSFYAPARRCQLHREQPLTDLVEPTDDQGWTLAENGCHERKGPVGLVDSEDGQLEREVENQQQQQQQLDLAVGDGEVQGNQQHARAFGQATNIVAAADCVDGGGRLSQILLGKRSKK